MPKEVIGTAEVMQAVAANVSMRGFRSIEFRTRRVHPNIILESLNGK